jgi:hypothetical protein
VRVSGKQQQQLMPVILLKWSCTAGHWSALALLLLVQKLTC